MYKIACAHSEVVVSQSFLPIRGGNSKQIPQVKKLVFELCSDLMEASFVAGGGG